MKNFNEAIADSQVKRLCETRTWRECKDCIKKIETIQENYKYIISDLLEKLKEYE